MIRPLILLCFATAILACQAAVASELADQATLRAWIAAMKEAERGPFARIRWFCNDGEILPPEPYACVPHGGGHQHGEWNEQIEALRANGYAIANIYADLDVETLVEQPNVKELLGQILIEQYLVTADDGWILRQARFYRGAFQEEGERAGARNLLLKLAEDPNWLTQGYLPLRTAARLLRHGKDSASAGEVRQVATALANQDPNFRILRNKIHNSPEAADAAAVRDYAARLDGGLDRSAYEALAAGIDAVYAGEATRPIVEAMARETANLGDLGEILAQGASGLDDSTKPALRFAITGELMALLRDRQSEPRTPNTRVGLLDTSLALEAENFAAATRLRERLDGATRRERLDWLWSSIDAIYGAGLISGRQREALDATLTSLSGGEIALQQYKAALDYLALVPGWAAQWYRFHFQEAMHRLATIEPAADLFIQDQLRGSPLFLYAQVLDSLLRDANGLAGVRNELFGEDVGAGLRSLNPGLARGRLSLAMDEHQEFRSDGIYLLPETVADLPPVAGILTAGEGNPLSHVQLLARNLGIPNVALDEGLVPRLEGHDGRSVILAVSPRGSVRLAEDTGEWQALFGAEEVQPDVLIRPDLEKLDLSIREFLPLSQLRASHSGRTVGPKAAKLGELKHHFPDAVAEGLAIPFGEFRRLLDQPYDGSGQSVYDWMVGRYRALEALPAGSPERQASTEAFRAELQAWIETAEPGADFRNRLREAMAATFGPDGSYGVFVRSDTNVEDLPGFTGAGLNLTVPNVVGFDNVVRAVSRVWASPFTARAFAWRQSHMDQPEHVYPAVLLLRSVPADKSGVLVTQDIDSGAGGWLSVAVNEGVGGAVDGQAAESLRINTANGEVKLLAQATAPIMRRVNPTGGVDKIAVSGADSVLQPAEIDALIELAANLPRRFPAIVDADGNPAPADIEFGFLDGELKLFQIRPFLESSRARSSAFLNALDSGIKDSAGIIVDLSEVPPRG